MEISAMEAMDEDLKQAWCLGEIRLRSEEQRSR
jgi:hypothetical protein